MRDTVEVNQFFEEVRSNEKNIGIYNVPASALKGKSLKDLNLSEEGERHFRRVEEDKILKRWKSPSIIEALQYPNVLRLIIFNTAIFFKFRVVNKRMQIYSDQIDSFTSNLLHVTITPP